MTVHIVKAPAGLGKTSQIIEKIAESNHERVEIYVPTLALANEIGIKLQTADVTSRVIVGRAQADSTKLTMCRKPALAAEVSKLGYPVFPVICMGQATPGDRFSRGVCEHFSDCSYLKQFEAAERVLIFTHAYLPLPRNNKESKSPSLVVIDESFLSTCLETHELRRGLLVDAIKDTDKTNVRAVVDVILKACDEKLPILEAARSAALSPEILKLAQKEGASTGASFNPCDSDATFLQKLQKFGCARLRMDILIDVLAAELNTARTESHGITFDDGKQLLRVHHRKPIIRFKVDTTAPDIIIIDANADPQLIEPWFPNAEFQDIPATRKAYVIQCLSIRGSTSSFVPGKHKDPGSRQKAKSNLAGLQELIDRECHDGAQRWLIVGPQSVTGNTSKGVSALLTCPPNAAFAHFNGLRGVDAYKEFHGVIIIGRNQPPIDALEDLARALWYDAEQPLTFATEWIASERAYRMRDPADEIGIEVEVHPDPRIQRLHEQIREGESTQAIDRLRLIHATEPKRVIIISNIPLEIEVDELRSFNHIAYRSRLQQAWAAMNGFLPLSSEFLTTRFPHLWKTADAAKKDVTRENQKGQFVNSISINDLSLLNYQYRVVGQTRPSRAISVLAVDPTLRALTLGLQRPIILRPMENGIPGMEVFSTIGRAELQPITSHGVAMQTASAVC